MLNSKTYIVLIACSLPLFSGCIESKYSLDIYPILESKNTRVKNKKAESFLAQLPGIRGGQFENMPVSVNAKEVEVYLANFNEALIEKNNILEFTILNDNSTIPRVEYSEVDGAKATLYLLKYRFKYNDGTDDHEATAIVFLSFRYRAMAIEPFYYCTAKGPSYWGILTDSIITFNSELNINQPKTSPYLSFSRKKKKDVFELLFMPAFFSKHPDREGGSFDITKILRIQANRIGGGKPLVFYTPEVFHDRKALHFEYLQTIKIN